MMPLVFDFTPPPSPGYCVCTPLPPAATVTVATTEPAAPLGLGDGEDADERLSSGLSSLPVSEHERQQVDSFFRGLKTQVFVCGSLTNLYFGSTAQGQEGAWELRYTGIPVVLLDTGEARARNKRRIQILLAERGSCFTLWQDTIDNLSSYREAGPAFHTMCLSSDHTTLIGLSFDCPQAAQQLWDHVERLTSCPENISLSGPGARGRGRKSPRKVPKPKPVVLPSKAHISQPCCFQHVTSVDRKDRDRYFSLQTLVPALAEIEKVVPNVS
ncbi:D-lysergyl-peptide-synthetase subunit 1 [Frankliniella fusca]|uniref:D-lysergyl-peptide-synthetase subunit 1 n=1 Tax=Frankliniella fusca TaxID=407009 RepID=A0AAE1HAH6_9NEOP|nr:D-lysergyl-peptide-synthetase subunit 1 [Frankliniella fusca]